MSVVMHTKFDPHPLEHSEFLSVEELGLLILADLHMVNPPHPPFNLTAICTCRTCHDIQYALE
jgi:hypothetical protein